MRAENRRKILNSSAWFRVNLWLNQAFVLALYLSANIFFQSFFMLMTVQPSFFASAISASLNVPIFESAP